jgi:hypothetical protein
MFPRGYFPADWFPETYFPPVESAAPDDAGAGCIPQHFITPRRPEPDDPDPFGEDWFFGPLT